MSKDTEHDSQAHKTVTKAIWLRLAPTKMGGNVKKKWRKGKTDL